MTVQIVNARRRFAAAKQSPEIPEIAYLVNGIKRSPRGEEMTLGYLI
jgi:hypothetical protein